VLLQRVPVARVGHVELVGCRPPAVFVCAQATQRARSTGLLEGRLTRRVPMWVLIAARFSSARRPSCQPFRRRLRGPIAPAMYVEMLSAVCVYVLGKSKYRFSLRQSVCCNISAWRAAVANDVITGRALVIMLLMMCTYSREDVTPNLNSDSRYRMLHIAKVCFFFGAQTRVFD